MLFIQRLCLFLSFTLAMTGTCVATANMPEPSQTAANLDSIVATVNDSIITNSALQKQINITTAQLQSSHITVPPKANLRASVLQQMINQDLQLQIAKQNKIYITSAEIKGYIQSLANREQISVKQWRAQFKKHGLSNTDINKTIKDQLTMMAVQRSALAKSIQPTAAEMANIKNKMRQAEQNTQNYNIEDINISLPDNPSTTQLTAAQNTATKLISQLNQGKTVTPNQQIQITAMGWENANQLPTLFVRAVQGKQAGDIIGPIKASNGLHILKLNNVRLDTSQTPSAKKISQIAMQQKYMTALNRWLKTLRQSAYIHITNT